MPERSDKCESSAIKRGTALAGQIWRHPGNRNRRLRSIGRFLAWQFVKRVLGRPVVIRFHDRLLKCYVDSTSTSAALYFAGFPDFWEMKFLQAYLRPGDGFLDIGANAGVYSILASAYIGRDGVIDAFEPMERTARRIEEQGGMNGLVNLRVHRLAVADHAGILDFGFASTDAMVHMRRPGEQQHAAAQVNCICLDEFEPYRNYSVGKMDIEGAEPFALDGARNRLNQANPPVWLIELAGFSTLYGVSSEQVLDRLSGSGFDCAVFNPTSRQLEFTNQPWLLGVQNILAISRVHRAAIELRLFEYAKGNA